MNKKEVIKLIGKNRWNEFDKFMFGQTVGVGKHGAYDYFEWDVKNFLRNPLDRFFD